LEIDASIDEIKRLAASLGFRMELASDDTADQAPGDDDQVADDDTDDDAGDDLSVGFFVLIDQAGEHPLGPDAVSPSDIARFLAQHAADMGLDDEPEIDRNAHLKKQHPKKGLAKQAAAFDREHKPKRHRYKVDPAEVLSPETVARLKAHNAAIMAGREEPETDFDPASGMEWVKPGATTGIALGDFIAPELGEYDPAPKPATSFVVASARTRRVARTDIERKQQLITVTTDLKRALAAKPRDGVRIGEQLAKAKRLMAHGGFEQFTAEQLGLPAKTARNYLTAAKSSHHEVETANS
jgi:hypothetical protein